MLRLWIITSSLFVASFGVEVNFTSDKTCYSSGENMQLTAVYSGSGSVTAVEWFYSNRTASNLLVLASTCNIFGGIDAGYPDSSRMTFTCSQATNTFTLTLTGLENDEFDKSWGATFSLSAGAKPDVVQSVITSCKKCTCDCKCKKKCTRIVIPSIVFGSLGVGNLPIVIGGAVSGLYGRTTALVVDFFGIVCDVLSMVLGIVVEVEDCCEDAADCCEDSDCCEVECERNWIENTGAAFIAIGALVGIVAGVIFYLLWFGRMGPGNNGITKKDFRPSNETLCEKLLPVLESAYPKILLVKDLIRKVDAEESVVMEQLEELRRKDLIRQLDSGGFVRHRLDVKTRITKKDLRPWEEIVREMMLHVLESVYPNILSVKDLIRIDFAEESVVMEQLEELRRKDLIRQLDSGGFVRHFLDVKTGH